MDESQAARKSLAERFAHRDELRESSIRALAAEMDAEASRD